MTDIVYAHIEMTSIQTHVGIEDIRKIVAQIVAGFHPQKVILFGSHAYATATEDSDVDLLVLIETDEKPLHVAAHIAAAIDHPFPLDILVTTPAQFKAALERRGNFVTQIQATGVVLYES